MVDARGEPIEVGSYVAVVNTELTKEPRYDRRTGELIPSGATRGVAKRAFVESIDEAAGTCVCRAKSGRKRWTCTGADIIKIR